MSLDLDIQVRLQIDVREPFAEGTSFGNVGGYERLSGRALFAIDPKGPAYRNVVDLQYAPLNSDGLVEYSTEVYILKPVNLERGNRRLLYDVNNRGHKRVVQFFNDAVHSSQPATIEHAGNGFLMRRGYTVVWSGWQGDILPGDGRLTSQLPVATNTGTEITGLVRCEFIADEPGRVTFPLSGNDYTRSYPAASLDTASATFSHREYQRDARLPIPPDQWEFATMDENSEPVPSSGHCYLPSGFCPGWIYELIYHAKDPIVMGLGFTGVRDLMSFLLYEDQDGDGTPNPLRQAGTGIQKAYAWGRSQSGRFLREFVYRGFNEDARGRRVFDAVSPHVSGCGRLALNYRFAQPGRVPYQHTGYMYPSDQFPFAYSVATDPFTGTADGILTRPDTDPLVIHTQTSSEYWERRGSLVHTDCLGDDLADHERARVYLFSSAQHHPNSVEEPRPGAYRHTRNPLDTRPLLRALLDALDAWATDGIPPPASRVPTRGDETAVPADIVETSFPSIGGVVCPAQPNRLYVQDHGPDFVSGFMSKEPPEEDQQMEYTVLVPQIDNDGNDVPGVRTPHVEVPLATFTGWNFRPKGSPDRALAGVIGSYLPLAKTEEERKSNEDSRQSLEERYRSRDDYVRAITRSARQLVDQRLLLEEDADRYVERAKKEEAFSNEPEF